MSTGKEKDSKKGNNRTDLIREAKSKTARYCAYQERTQQEVRDKLYRYGLHQEEVENIIIEFIEEGFINEERYAVSFARGKFNQNKWGKLKIDYGLKQKGISPYCRDKALSELDIEDYKRTIENLIDRKNSQLGDVDLYIRKNKIAMYLISKGFEKDIIWNVINERLKS